MNRKVSIAVYFFIPDISLYRVQVLEQHLSILPACIPRTQLVRPVRVDDKEHVTSRRRRRRHTAEERQKELWPSKDKNQNLDFQTLPKIAQADPALSPLHR